MNTWAEAMKAIGSLEDRVEELEARIPAPEIRTMKAPSPTPTETGRILVDPDEWDHLQRLNEAAWWVALGKYEPAAAVTAEQWKLGADALQNLLAVLKEGKR